MNTIRIKSYSEFVIGKYRNSNNTLRRKDVTEEQIMAALGKSKSFTLEIGLVV